jgi:phospholipase/carboxylesterase
MAEGVFDEADIVRRAADLAAFVSAAATEYGFDATQVIALGFSNGANIAAAMMLLNPEALAGGMLIRAMVPLVPATAPSLAGKPVIMVEGAMDPLIPRANAEHLATMLREAGAAVTLHWEPSGHGLTPTDVAVARSWYAELR